MAVKEWGKQVIAVTHSMDILKQYQSDIGEGTPRGVVDAGHVRADPGKFSLMMLSRKETFGPVEIKPYEMKDKKFSDVRRDLKRLVG